MKYLLTIILFTFHFCLFANNPTIEAGHCQKILDNLIKAHGEERIDYPKIKVIKRKKNIASYSPISNQIIIEQYAYNLCMDMGDQADDALAFLISHELTHFFQIKDWSSVVTTMAFYDDNGKYKSQKENEAEADRYGAFLCYLASYDYQKIAPRIISHLYEAYSFIHAENDNYPGIEERKTLTTEVCEVIRQYVLLFESANYLHLIGEYDMSQSIYEYLLKYLDLSELFHNAGTNQLKAGLSATHDETIYPVEVIYQLNLRYGQARRPESLFTAAIHNLIKAARRNPSSHNTYINLAVAYEKLKRSEESSKIISDLKKIELNKTNQEKVQLLHILFDETLVDHKIDSLKSLHKKINSPFVKDICLQNIQSLQNINSNIKKIEYNSISKDEFPIVEFPFSDSRLVNIDNSDPLFPLTATITENTSTICSLTKGNKTINIIFEGSLMHKMNESNRKVYKYTDINAYKFETITNKRNSSVYINVK